MNAVDRQISATTTAMSSWFGVVGSSQMYGWSITPIASRIVFR